LPDPDRVETPVHHRGQAPAGCAFTSIGAALAGARPLALLLVGIVVAAEVPWLSVRFL
jgi:hypothetical protein